MGLNRQTFAIIRSILNRQDATRERHRERSPLWPEPRTLADDLRDFPRPVAPTPHVHFHSHGGSTHVHEHVHPDTHAHTNRSDEPAHRS